MILTSVITVNYNHSHLTDALLDSLNRSKDSDFELIIVDNGSDVPYELPSKSFRFPTVVIRSKKNLGFAGGNELGCVEARGKYLLLINNDTEVEDYFHSPLVKLFEEHPNLGILSPMLKFFDTGNIQFAGATALSPITLRNKSFGYNALDMGQFKGFKITGFIHGAAMMVPKAVYDELGGMWEPFFLYYEEYDWCHRIQAAGYDAGFTGDTVIWHKESASVGKMSPLKIKYMTRNRILYARRNVGFYWPLTLLYLIGLVALRDTILYAVKGQGSLLKALWTGVHKGIKDKAK